MPTCNIHVHTRSRIGHTFSVISYIIHRNNEYVTIIFCKPIKNSNVYINFNNGVERAVTRRLCTLRQQTTIVFTTRRMKNSEIEIE